MPSSALAKLDAFAETFENGRALPAAAPGSLSPVRIADTRAAALLRDRAVKHEQTVPTRHRAVRNERWRFLQLVDRFRRKSGMGKAEAHRHVCLFCMDEFSVIKAPSYSTYRNWLEKVELRNGRLDAKRIDSLLPAWNGRPMRERYGDPRFWQFLDGLYRGDVRRSLATSYRLAMIEARKRNYEDLPSFDQVEYWYTAIEPQDALKAARLGEDEAKNLIVGSITRDWSGVAPNDVWFGDNHVFDCLVKDWDEEKGRLVALRPYLVAWSDGRSLYIVGYTVTTSAPTHLDLIEALWNGIQTNGGHGPNMEYTDNGKDFKKIGFTVPYSPDGGKHEHMIVTDLGASDVKRSKEYVARSKTIERIFGMVCGGFSKLWPSYVGSKPQERPSQAKYFYEHPEELPTRLQFMEAFAAWLAADYHATPQKGRILDGKAPRDVWTPGTGAAALQPDELKLALALPCAAPVVRAGGVVRWSNYDWRSEQLWPHIGRKVMMRVDCLHGRAYACRFDGRLICDLHPKPTVAAIASGDAERRLLGEELAFQRRHERRIRDVNDAATGGTMGLSAIERMQIDADRPVKMITRGKANTVKGPVRTYHHVVAEQDGAATGFGTPAEHGQPPPAKPTRKVTAAPKPPPQDEDADLEGMAAALRAEVLARSTDPELPDMAAFTPPAEDDDDLPGDIMASMIHAAKGTHDEYDD